MNQEQIDRIAKLLRRISDPNERDQVTREIGKVLADTTQFDIGHYYEMADVKYLEDRSAITT